MVGKVAAKLGKLNLLNASVAVRKLAKREITAVSLLQDCLEHIAAREPTVHAWTFVDGAAAMQRARMLDSWGSTGLLHGLPIAVKDLFDTADMPTSYGSPIYAGHRPAWDAASVALAKAAGAIVVGKTVTTEFATFHPGPTCNPRNPKHTPGGSSSGSAACIADHHVPLAFGTQTAGSIVRPAAFCGVVGYKPTFGTINRAGVKGISDTLDTVGVLARSVPDVALFAAALSGRRELFSDSPATDVPRIGLCRTYEWSRAQPETVSTLEDAGARLRSAGATVRDLTLPAPFAGLVDAQITIMIREVALSLAHENIVHRTQLSSDMTRMVDAGLAVSPQEYDAAQALARTCRALLRDVFDGIDVLIAPSAIGEAPAGIATGDPLFNRMWTLLHVPVVHVPVAEGPHGLPVGITVVGAARADRATLRAAEWIHAQLGGMEQRHD